MGEEVIKGIQLSVALPMFCAKDCAWIALESLCRQQTDSRFHWELIVCEETASEFNPFGEDNIRSYEQRLPGCQQIIYIGIKERVALSRKWKMMAEAAKGEIFILQAADDYANPMKLLESWLFINNGYDWINSRNGYFYDIHTGLIRLLVLPDDRKNGLNMAIKTNLVRGIKNEDRWSWVDGWLYENCELVNHGPLKTYWNTSSSWKNGLFTCGYNTISIKRSERMKILDQPYYETDVQLDEIVPQEIAMRLKKC